MLYEDFKIFSIWWFGFCFIVGSVFILTALGILLTIVLVLLTINFYWDIFTIQEIIDYLKHL
jgi:low affinity Fe/Cu permease